MKSKLFSLDFFQSIHEKDAYHETIMDAQLVSKKILNHLLVMISFSFCYGIVMGCYNGNISGMTDHIWICKINQNERINANGNPVEKFCG